MNYLIRLDDASEHMNVDKWEKIIDYLNNYNIKAIIGVIPKNEDVSMVDKYPYNYTFWNMVKKWEEQGHTIAMHGYNHVYSSKNGGINPVHNRSEFAGMPKEIQVDKIRKANNIFKENDLNPQVFFAPSHTFDNNTLESLKEETNIRIISDTISNDIYYSNEFYFIPQQVGAARKTFFKLTTFCYHPNEIGEAEFSRLKEFVKKYRNKFVDLKKIKLKKRKKTLYDKILARIYFLYRKIKKSRKK